jgi:hypothetical protein
MKLGARTVNSGLEPCFCRPAPRNLRLQYGLPGRMSRVLFDGPVPSRLIRPAPDRHAGFEHRSSADLRLRARHFGATVAMIRGPMVLAPAVCFIDGILCHVAGRVHKSDGLHDFLSRSDQKLWPKIKRSVGAGVSSVCGPGVPNRAYCVSTTTRPRLSSSCRSLPYDRQTGFG